MMKLQSTAQIMGGVVSPNMAMSSTAVATLSQRHLVYFSSSIGLNPIQQMVLTKSLCHQNFGMVRGRNGKG